MDSVSWQLPRPSTLAPKVSGLSADLLLTRRHAAGKGPVHRLIADRQLRGFDDAVVVGGAVHDGIQDPCCEQRAFDRIGRVARVNRVLDGSQEMREMPVGTSVL